MNSEERVLNQFLRKPVDYLPSQITFSDRTRDKGIANGLGIREEELDSYLGNHIYFTYNKNDDIPIFYRGDDAVMKQLEDEDYIKVDWDKGIVYDNWGMGILRDSDGLFTPFGPMIEDEEIKRKAKQYMPDRLKDILDMELEEAVEAFTAPDPYREDNYDWYKRDLKEHSGEFMVIPSGYFGIYERAYATLGLERFMVELIQSPEAVYKLMEKITDYRIKTAKIKAELGFKIIHHGDDLGEQCRGFFPPKMFKELFLPHYKKLYAEYKKYGMYIIQHSCGNIIDYLPDLIDCGLDGIEPVQPCMDLNYLKKEFGEHLVFWGGIDTQKMPFITPDEVRELAREAIAILGKGGGYIIAPSQELMNDVPLENIVALVETIFEMRDKVM